MGGRKEDQEGGGGKRTPKQLQKARRPLSAVLEELESDDMDLKENTTTKIATKSANNQHDHNHYHNNYHHRCLVTDRHTNGDNGGAEEDDNKVVIVDRLVISAGASDADDDDDGDDESSSANSRKSVSEKRAALMASSLIPVPTACVRKGSGNGSSNSSSSNSKSSSSSCSSVTPRALLSTLEKAPSAKIARKMARDTLEGGRRRQALVVGCLASDSTCTSPKTARRRGSGLLTSRFADLVMDSDDENALTSPSDMTRLRQMTERLRLSTRRASVLQWRQQLAECPNFPTLHMRNEGQDGRHHHDGEQDEEDEDEDDGRWSWERAQKINAGLDWIKNELVEMRAQDQQLARQLLTIRSDLQDLKLARSCEQHQDMLDDVRLEMEELQELADVLDLPNITTIIPDSPLHQLGVTRMNLNARRFSTC